MITSVAGDRGRPRNYTYGAAKGALNIYLQGLRTRLYASGVTVTTIKLGPVDTPMTTGTTSARAVRQNPATVAHSIVAAIDAGIPGSLRALVLAPDHARRQERAGELVPEVAVPVGPLEARSNLHCGRCARARPASSATISTSSSGSTGLATCR